MKHLWITATLVLFLTVFIGFTIPVRPVSAVTFGTCTCADGNSLSTTQADCAARTCAQSSPCCTFTADPTTRSDSDPTSRSSSGDGQPVKLQNPLGETDVRVIVGRVIRVALGIVGSLALLIIIYGGLTWLLSFGNEERVKQGRDTLLWAAVGLVVILTSYVIVNFLFTGINEIAI